ncbi:oxidation resistance protein 1-like [Trifolium pratense]|uniref:oxidation resistance protein 1-like n=1 Tax=Trifolium pratense TaxID=57577 RepID=UPI001E69031F|nr:oxidation resistance protein 1-like [Trifolium pratense]
MYTRKVHRFSRIFSKSYNSLPKVGPNSKERKYLLSYFSYIMTLVNFGASKTRNLESVIANFKYKKRVMCNMLKDKIIDEDHASRRSNKISENLEEVKINDQFSPHKLIDDSCFISLELNDFFESCIPKLVKGCKRVLLYSTLKHGTSLRTLIRKSAQLTTPGLLVVGDMQGAVFGALLDCPLIPTTRPKYQGTHQTFVFTNVDGHPRIFRPTGANRYYYLCSNDSLALGGGGGGGFALYLDGDLLTGTSGPSDTFGNQCLAHTPEFELKNVELWGFTHASS